VLEGLPSAKTRALGKKDALSSVAFGKHKLSANNLFAESQTLFNPPSSNGSSSASCTVHCTSISSVSIHVNMNILVMYDKYLSCLTHASILCAGQSAASNDPQALPNPSPK
jgi:hypothetical protein